MKSDDNNRVDCFKCAYFAVTWDTKSPKMCKLFGFKSVKLPSLIVFETTGSICNGFTPKKNKIK